MPELPVGRRARFAASYGLSAYDVEQVTASRALADFFEDTVRNGASPKSVSNWMQGELARTLNELGRDVSASPVDAARLAGLIQLLDRGAIGGPVAKQVFEALCRSTKTAAEIVEAEGLGQIDDDEALEGAVTDVVSVHADAVAQYRGGKASALGFLVGQVMKATGGRANAKRVSELLRRALG
jgi:aspartyl-tRNA(Asn)/glutamyl-tRNA(Gln) amidotransferase subunit B